MLCVCVVCLEPRAQTGADSPGPGPSSVERAAACARHAGLGKDWLSRYTLAISHLVRRLDHHTAGLTPASHPPVVATARRRAGDRLPRHGHAGPGRALLRWPAPQGAGGANPAAPRRQVLLLFRHWRHQHCVDRAWVRQRRRRADCRVASAEQRCRPAAVR